LNALASIKADNAGAEALEELAHQLLTRKQ